MNYDHKYDDIINLKHHISNKHPQMSIYARSSQFAPFAALTGYEDLVKETARETNEKIEIDDEQKMILDSKLQILIENIKCNPEVNFIFFVPDDKKDGGMYKNITGIVSKINTYNQCIYLIDNTEIPINDIIEMSGEIFKVI